MLHLIITAVSVYNAAPIKETVPKELYDFLMKLDSPRKIVKVMRLYIEVAMNY